MPTNWLELDNWSSNWSESLFCVCNGLNFPAGVVHSVGAVSAKIWLPARQGGGGVGTAYTAN